MMNARGWTVVVLASLVLASVASAYGDTTPDRSIVVDCAKVRAWVAVYGVDVVLAAARARGVPQRAIDATARRCLR